MDPSAAWLTPIMEFFSFLGREEFYLLIMPALYWCLDTALGIRVGLILMLSAALNDVLKLIFHAPRPYWTTAGATPLSAETSFGLPSGHAMNAVSVWGRLAVGLRRAWGSLAALALMLLIGLSRLYLGVHFPFDVVGGWLFGALLLVAFLALERPAAAWLRRLSLAQQVAVALAVSLALIGLAGLALAALGTWQPPAEWARNAALATPGLAMDPLSLRSVVSNAGALFGLASGAAWLMRRRRYDAGGGWGQRLLRYLVGLLGVVILWQGLGAIFPRDATPLALVLRYARYALIGAWVTAAAPVVFMQLGLARRAALPAAARAG